MKEILIFSHKYPYLIALVSLFLGYIFMPIVVEIARKYNFIVSPNKRTSHAGDIPNVGGLNIFISFLITVYLFSFEFFSQTQFVVMGLIIILIIGFIDDLITLKVHTKLLGQLLSAFFLIVIGDVRISNLQGLLGIYELPIYISYIISFFIFVVIVNAMNLIDGIDGLASGLGVIYSLFYAIYFQAVNYIHISIISYAMVGSLAVFFIYNVFSKDRKIFMGDSGSLLLGYVIIVQTFMFNEINSYDMVSPQFHFKSASAFSFTLLIIPLFDTLRVMLTRIKKGYSPFKADRNHIHHLLLGLGLKHRQVSFILIGINVLFILLGLILRNFSIIIHATIVLSIASILTFILWRLVDYKNLKEENQNDKNISI